MKNSENSLFALYFTPWNKNDFQYSLILLIRFDMTNSTSLIETRARLSNDAPAIRATTIPSDLGEAQVKKNRPKGKK